jgi:pimeloyl-ACP methyl ester carboxylesterase
MWVRRLLLVPLLLSFVALGAYFHYFYQAPPDARLACHYGAYDLENGHLLVVTPSTGRDTLRIVWMNGLTQHLKPVARDAMGKPTAFRRSTGWGDDNDAWPDDGAFFGSCSEGLITLVSHGPTESIGRRRTFDVTETSFMSHGLKLFGRLVMPRVEGAVPVAVLVHGSEVDSAVIFDRMQHLLPANGIGVFVYDKRGTGKSEGRYTQNFYWLADDAAAALTTARKLAGSLGGEVGFFGGSQAGWIEPLAAMKVKTDFVLVGFGLVESPLAEDREEVFDDLRSAGYGEDVIAKAREITDATGKVMSSGFTQGFDELDAVRAKYGREPWYKKVKGEYSGDLLRYPNWLLRLLGPWFDMGTSWTYDPRPALDAYQGPHLWVLAGRDSVAPSAITLRILRQVQASHPNLDIVVFPNTDHGILEFEEKNGERTPTRFANGYFQLLADWINFKQPQVRVDGPVVYDGDAPAADAQ